MGYPYEEEDKRAALTQGLLAAGLAALGARKGSEYNAFAQAGLLGLGGYQNSLRDATNAREQQAALRMRQEQYAMQKAQWEQQQAERAKMQSAAAGAFAGGMPEMGPPTPQGEMQQGVAPQFNPQAYISALQQQGLPMQAIAAAKEYAPKEKTVKETIKVTHNGQRKLLTMYTDGTRELLPYDPDLEKPHFVSTGAKVGVPLDPYTGKPLGDGVQATMSPDASARLGFDREKFNYDKSQAGGAGKPPEGYRWKPDGSVEPIPGGPKDTVAKDAAQAEGVIQRADLVIGKVDEVLGQTGFTTTGATGALLGRIPGRAAFDMRKNVETIKANLGFQELAAMRAASPTGGALGQVAVQELNALQASIANLDPDQSEAQLVNNLEQVKRHVKNWKALMQRAAGKGSGGTGGWSIEEVK